MSSGLSTRLAGESDKGVILLGVGDWRGWMRGVEGREKLASEDKGTDCLGDREPSVIINGIKKAE